MRYSVSNSPITLSTGTALQRLVSEASGRPILVQDPLDFKASIGPTYDGFGGWTMGALKFLGGRQAVGPTVIKIYGVEGVRNSSSLASRHRVMMRPITWLENGTVDEDGALLPFSLDPITREVLVDGQQMISPTTFDGLGAFPQQAAPINHLRASFNFLTPMEITEFSLDPPSGKSVQQTLIAGLEEKCVGYYLNMTLSEVIPVFDPVLQFDTVESVTPIGSLAYE